MKDRFRPALRARVWGWVAIVLGLVPGTVLFLYMAEGGGPSLVLALGVPFVALSVVGMWLLQAGGRLARGRAARADPARLPGRLGRPGRRVLGLMALMILFAFFTTPMCACGLPPEHAYEAAVKSDLRRLETAQLIYYGEHYHYATAQSDLEDFTWSEGVSIVMRAEELGFTARGTHVGFPDPDASCVIYVSFEEAIEPFRTLTGLEAPEQGQPFCDPDY